MVVNIISNKVKNETNNIMQLIGHSVISGYITIRPNSGTGTVSFFLVGRRNLLDRSIAK